MKKGSRPSPSSSQRLNAFLASAGLGSRRSVEEIILAGRVSVNGKITRDFSTRIHSGTDDVRCDGRPLRTTSFHYIALHKPPGYACTRHDPYAARTIYDLLPSHLQQVSYAGRLDIESEGLVLLSNDGAWLNTIAHPRYGVVKEYHVEVAGCPNSDALKIACIGVTSRDETLRVDSAEILKAFGRSTLLRVKLHGGKNREIRRLFGALKHSVQLLKRVSVGPIELHPLKKGEWRELKPGEVKKFTSSSQSSPGTALD